MYYTIYDTSTINSYPGTLSLDLDSMCTKFTLCSLNIFKASARAPTASVREKIIFIERGSLSFASMMKPPSTTFGCK